MTRLEAAKSMFADISPQQKDCVLKGIMVGIGKVFPHVVIKRGARSGTSVEKA